MEFSIEESAYVVPTPHQDHNILNPSYKEILKLNTMRTMRNFCVI